MLQGSNEAAQAVGDSGGGFEAERGPGGGDRWKPMLQEDLHILDGGDQPVLNLHAPESSPAGAFEAVMIGGIREADFRQMLSAASVASGGGAMCLLAGSVQECLLFMTMKCAPLRSTRTLGTQHTGRTHGFGQKVFPRAFGRMESSGLERPAGWATIGVGAWIVGEGAVGKDALTAHVGRGLSCIPQMRANPELLAGHKVLHRAVFAVGHRRLHGLSGIGLVLFHQL